MAEKDEGDLLTGEDRAFARALRARREAKGWSQGELAAKMRARGFDHLSQVAISRIEQLKRAARLGEARGLASVLEVPLAVMMNPNGATMAVLRLVLDRPAVAVQDLDVFQELAERLGDAWGHMRSDMGMIEQVAAKMGADLDEDPETVLQLDMYLESVRELLQRDPVALAGGWFEKAYQDAAAANSDQ